VESTAAGGGRSSRIASMIPRILQARLAQRLRQFPAVALLGPRQVGKTTLARTCPAAQSGAYPDLGNPANCAPLPSAPG